MRENGFTLIELLIAISIISILSVAGLVVYQGFTAKGRDSVRKSDLNKLAMALEIYAQQNDEKYIDGTPGVEGDCSSADTTTFYQTIASSMNDSVPPKDPSSTTSNEIKYCYISINDGKSYKLCANLENDSDTGGNTLCPIGYDYGVIPE